jgi:hypothetical protein
VRIMSMDLVRKISQMGEEGSLRMVYGDDPCLGVHIRQAVLEGPTGQVKIDDFGSYTRFAMDPVCFKTWGQILPQSWVVHHVTGDQIRCMWRADIDGGYYALADVANSTYAKVVSSRLWGTAETVLNSRISVNTSMDGEDVEDPDQSNYPDLCQCASEESQELAPT